jgi:HTH-type transcriptional repressor of NAD biosynthesis genes
MYKIGVMYGKFLPPHRGHLMQIISSATQCDKLYVVVSDNKNTSNSLCDKAGIKRMDVKLRAKWLSVELQNINHIQVLTLDESDIAPYPNGWAEWAYRLEQTVPEKFDVIFGGETEYAEGNATYFPYAKYSLFDYGRTIFPVSATEIRQNYMKHWDYILGSARGFFSKKVLITGTESCGKTTLTKYLAKLFYTSWSDEVGRYYADRFLGGNENLFTEEDFTRIAYQQYDQDLQAINTANRIVFFDTDATITNYYSQLYMGFTNKRVMDFVDPKRYDKVFIMYPNVNWVADGQRRNGEQKERENLHRVLTAMYHDYGFTDEQLVEISGTYQDRLTKAFIISRSLIGE